MKYILLIHQGDAPTPNTPEEWVRLSEEERNAVFADYQAINQMPGVTPGVQMQPAETSTTVRVQDGRTLTTDGPFVAVKRRSAATSSSRRRISTPRSTWRRGSRRRGWAARWRCARSTAPLSAARSALG